MPTHLQLQDDAAWKRRYRFPYTYGAQIASENPAHGLAVSSRTGVDQLYAWHTSTGELRQVTFHPEGKGNSGDGILNAAIAPNGQFIYYLDDTQGDETGHFVRVPFAGGEPEDITPDAPPYVGFLLGFDQNGRRLGFTGIVDGVYHIYTLTLDAEERPSALVSLYTSEQQTLGPILSADGALAIIQTKRPGEAEYDLLALDTATGAQINTLTEPSGGLEVYLSSPVAGDARCVALGNGSGFERPLLWDARTGVRQDLDLPLAGNFTPLDWSADGQRLLLRRGEGVSQRLYSFHLRDGHLQTLQPVQHATGSIGGTEPRSAFFGAGNTVYALWQDSAHPLRLIAFDSETGEELPVPLAMEIDAPAGHPWRTVSFPSSDGAQVQGWLATPEGEGPFPTILEMHGGPQTAATDVFSPSSQCWLDHGFAYLSINYRGSTNFGADFQNKIRGDLGHWEVEDILAARSWLIAQRIAHPSQIMLTGWSYGGYLTLQTLGTAPDDWAGGMAGIAMSDLAMNDADGSTIKAHLRGLMGGAPDELPEQYRRSSPITYVEQVQAPILIIQGRNDPRSKPRQIEVYAERLRALGKPIEVLWFDAGHGELSVERQIAHQEAMLKFAYRALGVDQRIGE